MNQRKRFRKFMEIEKLDRLPFMDFGYWDLTIKIWHSQGLPKVVQSSDDLEDYLFLDRNCFDATVDVPKVTSDGDLFPVFDEEILEENNEYITKINKYGVKVKEKKDGSSVPHFLEYPVKSFEDFEKIKPRLNGKTKGRYPDDWEKRVACLNESIIPISLFVTGFFGHPRNLMGLETLCLSFYDQPELIKTINEQHAEFIFEAYERVLRDLEVDLVTIWEDMAYKNASLVSPTIFEEFMMPYYKKVVAYFKEMGVKAVFVDSDGNVKQLLPLFIEAGVDGIYPCEVQSGSDPVELRKISNQLFLAGGIDKKALIAGPEAIDKELSKVKSLCRKGRYLPMVDHRVPPDVSYENYLYYCQRKRELLLKLGG